MTFMTFHILGIMDYSGLIWFNGFSWILMEFNGFSHHIWECHAPNCYRTPSFFRGVAKNHQPDYDEHCGLVIGYYMLLPTSCRVIFEPQLDDPQVMNLLVKLVITN